jgi:hypothetical protein
MRDAKKAAVVAREVTLATEAQGAEARSRALGGAAAALALEPSLSVRTRPGQTFARP